MLQERLVSISERQSAESIPQEDGEGEEVEESLETFK